MTMLLDRTGATSGDFEWMSSRSEETTWNQTRPAPIADSVLKDVLVLLDSVQGGILTPIRERNALSARTFQSLSSGFVQYTIGTPDLLKDTVWRLFLDDRRALEFSLWVSEFPTDTVGIPQIIEAQRNLTSGDANLVEIISDVAQRLGLPMEQVLEAADIPSSTYYLWKKADGVMRPRLSSHRRLWSLVQFVEDAEERVGSSLQQWLLARPERHALLLAGEFDSLLKNAVVLSVPEREFRRDLSVYAVGGDSEESESPPSQAPSRPGRRPGKVRVVAKKSDG